MLAIVRRFFLGWGHVADGREQPPGVVPVDPFERRIFHRVEVLPRSAAMDYFGLEQTDDGLGERVIVGIPRAADRGLDARRIDLASKESMRKTAAA